MRNVSRSVGIIALAISLAEAGCGQHSSQGAVTVDSQLPQDLASLSGLRIYFGHQSVGYNIVGGLTALQGQVGGAKLNVVELGKVSPLPQSYFLHSPVGINGQPETKCRGFADTLRGLSQESIDIAFFKFCYVDFNGRSNPEAILETYSKQIDPLKQLYPGTTFVHVTVPLMSTSRSLSALARTLLGRPDEAALANAKRNDFNRLLVERYRGEPVFDLARVEYTHQDGTPATYRYADAPYNCLADEYTTDGGHLNPLGSQLAARELLGVLARAAAARQRVR